MTSLSPTTLTFEDVLRALGGPWTGTGNTLDQLVKRTGRVRSNLKRDLGKLVELGLVQGDADLGWTRSPQGSEALDAIDRANGFIPEAARPTWPLAKIEFNPDNPRKGVDDEPLRGLADSIVAAEGLLQPIVLYPIGASGARMLHAGERRVRACRLLEAEGRLPDALAAGLPFIERPASKAEALFIGLVENSQREDLTPFEDALALKAYKDETGLSARAIAFKLGRAREGSETGVRDVQEKIAVLERAAPAAIEKVWKGQENFDWLKRQIRKRIEEVSEQLRPIDLMVLAEVVHKGRRTPFTRFTYGLETECAHDAPKDPVFKALVSQGVLKFSAMNYNDPRSSVNTGHSEQLTAILISEEFGPIYQPSADDADATKALHALRVAAVGEEAANAATQSGRYVCAWLNGPFAYTDEQQAKMAALKTARADSRAEGKRLRERDEARLQAVIAIDELVVGQGVTGQAVDRLTEAFADKGIEFPLRPERRGIVDAKGRHLIASGGLGYQYQPREAELLQLICTVMNAVLAPTPLEAAIEQSPDQDASDAAA